MYDTTEKLVLDAEISAGVLGNPEGEFVLLWLDKPFDQTAMAAAERRGLVYCGALGVLDGRAVVEPGAAPGVERALLYAGLEFARAVAEHLTPEPKGDAVSWLQALYSFPDNRGGEVL